MINWFAKVLDSIQTRIGKCCFWFLSFSGSAPQQKVDALAEEVKHRDRQIEILRGQNVLLVQLVQFLNDSGSHLDKIAYLCIGAIEKGDELEATAINRCLKLHRSNMLRLSLYKGKFVAEVDHDLRLEADNAVDLLQKLVATGRFNTYHAEFPPDLRRHKELS